MILEFADITFMRACASHSPHNLQPHKRVLLTSGDRMSKCYICVFYVFNSQNKWLSGTLVDLEKSI